LGDEPLDAVDVVGAGDDDVGAGGDAVVEAGVDRLVQGGEFAFGQGPAGEAPALDGGEFGRGGAEDREVHPVEPRLGARFGFAGEGLAVGGDADSQAHLG